MEQLRDAITDFSFSKVSLFALPPAVFPGYKEMLGTRIECTPSVGKLDIRSSGFHQNLTSNPSARPNVVLSITSQFIPLLLKFGRYSLRPYDVC